MTNDKGSGRGGDPLRFHAWLMVGIFFVAEACLIGLDLFYLYSENGTLGEFFFDWGITTGIIIALVLLTYLLTRRFLLKYREPESRFEELADSLPEVVFEIDSAGTITYTNRRALDVFGYTQGEVAGGELKALQMLAEEDVARAAVNIGKVLSEGPLGINEYTARRKDGGTFPVMISSTPIIRDGRAVGLRGTMTDITELKKYEEEIERVNAELQGYAQTVSHDIKAPIHRVMMACQTVENLLKQPQTDDISHTIDEIMAIAINGLKKANHLVEELLHLAESGQVPAFVYPVDVAEQVGEILAERASDIEAKGMKVTVDDELGIIHASPTHIHQLFDNLIRNAIEYNESENPVLRISYRGEDDGHRYFIRDNGPGIPPDIIDRVFVPFTRGKSGDTGIGLSIVEKIVKVYDGTISVRNDGGACFEFALRGAPPGQGQVGPALGPV